LLVVSRCAADDVRGETMSELFEEENGVSPTGLSPTEDADEAVVTPVAEEAASELSPVTAEAEVSEGMSSALAPAPLSPAAAPCQAMTDWRSAVEERLKEQGRIEAERKSELIAAGQAELARMMEEVDKKRELRRKAAMEENVMKEEELAKTVPNAQAPRTRAESWALVHDLIDFKRDTATDLSAMRSMIISLKHAKEG